MVIVKDEADMGMWWNIFIA